jgi:hypothetical protein
MLLNLRRSLLVLATALFLSPSIASAAINITFEGDTLGSQPSTAPAGPGTMTKPSAIGGYAPAYESPPTAAAGTIVVGGAGGILKGAIMTTAADNPELGATWIDVNGFNYVGQVFKTSFDLSVLSAPTNATSQPKILNGGTAGILLGMNAFTTTSSPAFRFAVAPTSDTGGVFAFRSPDNSELIDFFDYVEGVAYNIAILADYSTGKLDAYVNGNLELDNYAFWTSGAANVGTSELFFHLNGDESGSTSVALDNITGAVVPEPSTIVVWSLLGLVAVGGWQRSRKNAAN